MVAAPKEEETTKTIVIHQKELHVCEYCKKDIPEDELEIQHIRVGHGRSHSYRTAYYHKSCLAKKRKEEAEREKAQRNYEAIHNARKCWGWSIPCGIVALVITLICLLNYSEFTTMQTIGISVLAGYGIFGMIYCIVSGSYIGEVFAKCAGFSVHFPGIIFSLDFDGIKFLIIMKLIFAVLGFLIGVFAIIFAILLSATLGGISFPFVLIHNKRNGYDDVL